MEIKVSDEALTEVEFDVNVFKRELVKDWNLKEAVSRSVSTSNQTIVDYIYNNMDWGKIIDFIGELRVTKFRIRLVQIEYKDWVRFYTGTFVKNTFKFKTKKESGSEVMLIQSLIKDKGFDLYNLVRSNQYRYDKEWKPPLPSE